MGIQTKRGKVDLVLVANSPIIEVKDKINLTIEEASLYSGIGETTIRKMLKQRACPFLLKIGNKHLIKRKAFEYYLEEIHYI